MEFAASMLSLALVVVWLPACDSHTTSSTAKLGNKAVRNGWVTVWEACFQKVQSTQSYQTSSSVAEWNVQNENLHNTYAWP